MRKLNKELVQQGIRKCPACQHHHGKKQAWCEACGHSLLRRVEVTYCPFCGDEWENYHSPTTCIEGTYFSVLTRGQTCGISYGPYSIIAPDLDGDLWLMSGHELYDCAEYDVPQPICKTTAADIIVQQLEYLRAQEQQVVSDAQAIGIQVNQ